MKKILVTGSNGYIGHNLIKLLQLSGHYVVGLDYRDCGFNIGDEFIHQNILDTNRINTQFDTVIHLAALVQVGGGQKAMMDYYRTNVIGTMNMLEYFDYDNFIFASTCQAFESNVYGTTKRLAEQIIRQYAELNDIDYTIFRFGNVLGGTNLTNTDGLLYNLIRAKETGTFNVYGDGTQRRDYVHVNEISHAINLAVDRPSVVHGAESQPYFEYLGHGHLFTVTECVEAFKRSNECDFEVVYKPKRDGDSQNVHFAEVSPYMPPDVYTLLNMMKV